MKNEKKQNGKGKYFYAFEAVRLEPVKFPIGFVDNATSEERFHHIVTLLKHNKDVVVKQHSFLPFLAAYVTVTSKNFKKLKSDMTSL
jgi:hypothetical protein